MSWAEDMGYDIYDVMSKDYSDHIKEKEYAWITARGKKLFYWEMSEKHLRNTINMLEAHNNTVPIEMQVELYLKTRQRKVCDEK